jgi:hypothetical protein
MRAREFIIQESVVPKQLGRAFNHLEDLVFFYGSSGTMEALSHIEDFATSKGAQTIRMKWDGSPQIYWGREQANGPLLLAGHNGWSKKIKTSSPESIRDFIVNKSGSATTPEEIASRIQFADQFASLYPLFDQATPKDFVGFMYADGLFLSRPGLDQDGVYNFCPNPKSQTCYHVRSSSDLGKRIAKADVMVVGHAYFPEWGMPDASQQPVSDFSEFNSNPKLIVLGPIYNIKPIKIDTSAVQQVKTFLSQTGRQIDNFLLPVPGLSDLKDIFYRYVNHQAKAKRLDQISGGDFFNWLKQDPKISQGKKNKILELNKQNKSAVDAIFKLVQMVQDLKDNIIDQIEGEQGDIWDTHGEGRVRYADPTKQFGNIKLVPRKRWVPQ